LFFYDNDGDGNTITMNET